MLKGWKTYIVVGVGVVVNGLIAMGYIPESVQGIVNSILGFLGLGTLRAAVKNVETQ